jgi:hypothetical protein
MQGVGRAWCRKLRPVLEHGAGPNTHLDADRREQGSGSHVNRWLQRQSRVANPERRSHDRGLQIVRTEGHRSDSCGRAPPDRNQRRRARIRQVGADLQLHRRIRAIVASLQTRFSCRVRVVFVVVNVRRVASQRTQRTRYFKMTSFRGLCVCSRRFQKTGIRHTRRQCEQPHQHHRECGVALGAMVLEGLHGGCGLRSGNARRAAPGSP